MIKIHFFVIHPFSIHTYFSDEYINKPPSLPEFRPFIDVDMDRFTLPIALLMRPTKANCVQLYKDIQQHIEDSGP